MSLFFPPFFYELIYFERCVEVFYKSFSASLILEMVSLLDRS